VRSGGTLVTLGNPVRPGETFVLYGTGLGDLTEAVPPGEPTPLERHVLARQRVFAVFDSFDGGVLFAGLTPGGIGLAQFNVVAPAFGGQAARLVPMFLGVGSVTSNAVLVPIAAGSR
jgi:uncharacterized protein (TIGR03437 family)